MASLVITSGVHVGVRGAGAIQQDWFGSTPTTQFSTVTLTSANASVSMKQGPQAIVGHAGLSDEPIAFEFERRTRDTLTGGLAALAVKDLLNGGSRTTLSGAQDAVARSGFLANFAWSERNNAGGAPTDFNVWGVCRIVQPTVRGARETMTLLVYPCAVFSWTGTENVFVDPTTYAALPGGS
jgi:hypothetical protein